MSDIDTELSLVDEWRRLLARHAAVSGALEHELQERHGIGVNEFEALDARRCSPKPCR